MISRITCRKSFVILLLLSSPLVFISTAQAAPLPRGLPFQELQNQIDELKANTSTDPIAITVDCSAGETVTDALNSISNPVAPVTITINGNCTEDIVITRDNVTLTGATPTSGITGVAGSLGTIHVNHAEHVSINSMTITNHAVAGIFCDYDGYVTATGITINGGGIGLLLDSCIFSLEDSNIDAATEGAVAQQNSTLHVGGSTISHSLINGLNINGDSFASVRTSLTDGSSSHITDGNVGILVSTSSNVELTGAEVTGNVTGIRVNSNSTLGVGKNPSGTGTHISENTGNGIEFLDNSSVLLNSISGFATHFEVSNNGGYGITCGSNVSFQLGTPIIFSGNTSGDKLNCP